MSSDAKLGVVAIIAVAAVFLGLIGIWYTAVQNDRSFNVVCLQNGKHIVYTSLPGQSAIKKECK